MSPLQLLTAPGAAAIRVLLLSILVIATITDLRRRRIPNLLTFPAALLAFGVHAGYGGWRLGVASVLAYLLFFALGFLYYRTVAGKEIGAGDIKLLMTTSACIGFLPAAYVMFCSLVLVLLWLVLRWLVQGTARENFAQLYAWLGATVTPGAAKRHFRPVGMVDRTPHAPFMLAAALLCFYLERKGVLSLY